MVKVFVFGASGFIGNPVAKAFARAGHEVYGLTRSTEKAVELNKDEITGVIGDARKPETWIKFASEASIIINTSADAQDRQGFEISIIDIVTKIARDTGRKPIFIFTTGAWLYGHRPNELSEEDDYSGVPEEIAWRAEAEQTVIRSTDFRGVVLRPAMVYGKAGSLFNLIFNQASQGKVNIFGDENTRWGVVHTDDLAEAYLSAAENIFRTQGEIISVANLHTESVTEIARAALRVSGKPEGVITYSKPSNWLEKALSFSSRSSNFKAVTLLGFQQKHLGVVDGIETYIRSARAYQ
ncbi:NAD-P-binding protein [Endogone sp. FLAS-F59071]|nr:NAD-P-binding protein [Endogone sp. FLAS-F59071]|eukprot:RUS22357.1 NAD-P-binding protein [Endogone sp. FLAS-F59071]